MTTSPPDPSGHDSAPEPIELDPGAAAAPSPRFCGACGAPLAADGDPCPNCTRRARHSDAEILAAGARDRRSIWSAVALYVVLLGTMLVGALFMDSEDPASIVEGGNIIMLIHAGVVFLWCLVDRQHTFAGLRTLPSFKWIGLALVLPLCTFAMAYFIVEGLASVFEVPDLSYSEDYLSQGYTWAFVVLAVCVQPAVFEELAFRGVILGGMRRVFGLREAVVVSSLLFMMLHLSPLSFPHLFLIGVVLAILRIGSGSLYPCIIAHFIHNGLVLLSEHLGY